MLKQRENDRISFQISSINNVEAKISVTMKSYRQYLSYKNKLHKKKRKEKLFTTLNKLSINECNEKLKQKVNKAKNVFGIGCLVAKRTVFLANIDRDKMPSNSILKQGLKNYGLLYIYTINKSDDQKALKNYYFYFKTRSKMLDFYCDNRVNSSIDFSICSGNNNDDINFHLPIDDLMPLECLLDRTDYDHKSLHFNNYVKCIRSFYKKNSK